MQSRRAGRSYRLTKVVFGQQTDRHIEQRGERVSQHALTVAA
jgi:hypothetical protein